MLALLLYFELVLLVLFLELLLVFLAAAPPAGVVVDREVDAQLDLHVVHVRQRVLQYDQLRVSFQEIPL